MNKFHTLFHHFNISLTKMPNNNNKKKSIHLYISGNKSNGLSYSVQLAKPSWPLLEHQVRQPPEVSLRVIVFHIWLVDYVEVDRSNGEKKRFFFRMWIAR